MNSPLRIGVISRVASATVSVELATEAKKRGHHYEQIIFDSSPVSQAETAFVEAGLLDYDVLYYRTSLGLVWAQALQHYITKHSRRAINLNVTEFPFLNDKSFQTLAVADSGILTPKTILDNKNDYGTIINKIGTPFVAKACNSSQGKDVHLINSENDFDAFLSNRVKSSYIYQEFISHDYDCRIHLVDGTAVAGYGRIQTSDDFRCNVSLGARMESLDVAEEAVLFQLANKVSKVFGLELHAVDFLKSTKNGKYYFVEINNNPGWETSDTDATGVDMSAVVVDSFEKHNRYKIISPIFTSLGKHVV
jgi:RimK family alpha-L-glutamate ligase